MELKDFLFNELMKRGYAQLKDGRKVWDVADRNFLTMTPELARAFLKIREHPRYSKTVFKTEIELLEKHSGKFISDITGHYNLIDLGCGDGAKARAFIEATDEKGKIRFCPVGVNDWLANLALENVKKNNFSNVVEYKKQIAFLDELYDVVSLMRNGKFQKSVVLLLGSILASFEIHHYLFNLSRAMISGDKLIIGNGIRTGERFVNLENYKHSLFREWLLKIPELMGLNKEDVEYDARFANGRVEAFFVVGKDKKISHGEKEFEFKKGDEIVVAVLYKYFEDELREFCKMYFREVEFAKDNSEEYALILCVK